jgi:3-hydroxyisobutyrate dehydrogenase-like beta-hydroxyacid dehydrogenase
MTETAVIRVGFIGLGDQGEPIARRIADAGRPTTLWARRPEVQSHFQDSPASFAASPAELAAAVDLIAICVTDDAAVDAVLTGPQGVLAGVSPGALVVIHSTIHPDEVRRHAAAVGERGATLVDAPVSGGAAGAAAGRLLVMTGGNPDSIERCRPVFETFAGHIVHCGEVGAAQSVKLVNNLLFTANVAAASAAFELAATLGIKQQALASALARGSAASFALDVVTALGHTAAGFSSESAALLCKDVGHIVDIAGGEDRIPPAVLVPAQAALALMKPAMQTSAAPSRPQATSST